MSILTKLVLPLVETFIQDIFSIAGSDCNLKMPSVPVHRGVIRRNVNKLGAAQNVNRCIYLGRGRLPRP